MIFTNVSVYFFILFPYYYSSSLLVFFLFCSVIANIGPADYNYEETINSLRFATRAKSIKNKPKINEDPKDAMLREFQDEIAKLKAALAAEEAIAAGLPPPPGYDPAFLARKGFGPAPLPPRRVIVEKEVVKTTMIGVAREELEQVKAETDMVKKNIEQKQKQKEEELRQVKALLDTKKEQKMKSIQQTHTQQHTPSQ